MPYLGPKAPPLYIPLRTPTLLADACGGVCGDGFVCTDDGVCDEGVLITQGREAYGHHGYCSGWNACNDAATCALWACRSKGYAKLVSYGSSGECRNFATCNLLYDGPCGGAQASWSVGFPCPLEGVTDIRCSGYTATCQP